MRSNLLSRLLMHRDFLDILQRKVCKGHCSRKGGVGEPFSPEILSGNYAGTRESVGISGFRWRGGFLREEYKTASALQLAENRLRKTDGTIFFGL